MSFKEKKPTPQGNFEETAGKSGGCCDTGCCSTKKPGENSEKKG